MCLSAEASFGAAVILSGTGAVAIRRVKNSSQVLFAMIPLLFGIQQLVEGLIWLSYRHVLTPEWRPPLVLLFLIYAQIIWPVWVPLAVLRLEQHPVRRKILTGMLAAGIAFALYLTYCLLQYSVTVIVENHHLSYQLHFPGVVGDIDSVVYFLCTVAAPFVSSVKNMRLVGLAIFIAFLAAALFYRDTIISVWCYFAALISVVVLVVLHQSEKSTDWKHMTHEHFQNNAQ